MFTILHTSAEDLRISLTSPSQTTVILSDQNGENYEDNYLWTVLDDEATTALRDGSPPFTGSFRPDNPLSAFDGESTQGAWTLTIEDLIAGDDGELTYWEIQVSTPGAADDEVLPAGVRHFALTGSYPNPFNSSTRIHYVAPRTGPVALSLYNVLGQKIVTLFNGSVAAGSHHVMWDGRDGAGRDAATGLYIVRLVAPGETSTGKVVLVR
jgi:subtilisin-like proprotein convertase family protein